MKYAAPWICLLFLYGCTDAPTPQSNKELHTQEMIQHNISEAEKAKNEYLALQKKRQFETSL